MHDIEYTNNPVNGNLSSTQDEFLWGAAAIGAAIGRNPRQTHHLLTTGQIKCAKRKGGRWVATRANLRAEFGA
jgi:hypothetical protein